MALHLAAGSLVALCSGIEYTTLHLAAEYPVAQRTCCKRVVRIAVTKRGTTNT